LSINAFAVKISYFEKILKIKYLNKLPIVMQVILRQIEDCVIRRCEPADLIPVMEINMKTLPEHYSDYFYESLLSELPEAFLVAEINGRAIGYIMCKTEYGFSNFKKLGFVKKGHVVSVAVIEQQRKKGIGKALVEESLNGVKIKKCDELYLEVRCSNTDGVRLYEKLGFIIRQRLKAYYRDGEDSFLMAIEFDY
jgi:[ribosomal protein S18]-alanine N-acetyltransferase